MVRAHSRCRWTGTTSRSWTCGRSAWHCRRLPSGPRGQRASGRRADPGPAEPVPPDHRHRCRPPPLPAAPTHAAGRRVSGPPPPLENGWLTKLRQTLMLSMCKALPEVPYGTLGKGRLRAGSPRFVQNYRLTAVCQSVHSMQRGRVLSRENGTSACWSRQEGGLQK